MMKLVLTACLLSGSLAFATNPNCARACQDTQKKIEKTCKEKKDSKQGCDMVLKQFMPECLKSCDRRKK